MIEKLNARKLTNHFALIGWTITVCLIEIAYLLEVLKHERTLPYYLVILVLGSLPLVICWSIYKKTAESPLISPGMTYGYGILYAFVLLTGDTVLTFVYIFPILLVMIAYSDLKSLRNLAVLASVGNAVSIGIKVVVFQKTSADDIADYEIEFLATVLCMFLGFFACKLIAKINQNRMDILELQEREALDILNAVESTTETLSANASRIGEQAQKISGQSESAQKSIEGIAGDSADMAAKVQMQLSMSDEISQQLEHLTAVSEELSASFDNTQQLSIDGMDSVKSLSESTMIVADSKNQVATATSSLLEELAEAKEILSLINNITSQTNLLSLNASIEAARAGEHGKGFAVVAGEIQKLSMDTGDATNKISQILERLSAEANAVNHAVENLDVISSRQSDLVADTSNKFHNINDNIDAMTQAIRAQNNYLNEINNNNQNIAGSISGMSQFTQTLTTNSEHTLSMTQQSMEDTIQMTSLLDGMITKVKDLENTVRKS